MSTTEIKETPKAPAKAKNFKKSADVENFYRFVHEQGLREEAITILEAVTSYLKRGSKKKGRKRKIQ